MTSHASYQQLLGDLSVAVNRDHRRRRRRLIWLGATAAMFLTAAAVTAASQRPWWESAAPPVNPKVVHRQLAPARGSSFPPAADRARAKTVAEWNGATLVAAPVSGDGYCLIPALPGAPDIGFSCEYQLSDEVRSYAHPGSNARWIIYGRFTDARAATLDLREAVGADLRLTLQPGGFFIADLPEARWQALDHGAGPAQLLDDSGKRLATVCLAFGPSPRSPDAGRARMPSPLGEPPCKAPVEIPLEPQLSQAHELVETKLTHDFSLWTAGTTIAYWEAPDAGGKFGCEFVAPVPLPEDRRSLGTMSCGGNLHGASPQRPLTVAFSSGLARGSYEHLFEGSTDPSSGIVRVELQMPGVAQPVDFANGHFLGDIAATSSIQVEDAFVVGYDANGKEVARAPLSRH